MADEKSLDASTATEGRLMGNQRYVRPYLRRVPPSNRGAPTGRSEIVPADGRTKLSIARVPMIDGDYDAGGAYWGGPPALPLWCAWTSKRPDVALWERALTVKEAKAKLLERWPHIEFKAAT